MEAAHKLTWDHKGWRIEDIISTLYSQKDWNQTLVTKINQISAHIIQHSQYGGANEIMVHPNLFALIATLEYYNPKLEMLSGRYSVTIDESIPKDKIFVRRKDFPMEPRIFDNTQKNIVTIHSESPQLDDYKNREDIELHVIEPKDLIGEITIFNYP
jgi:hypothetical protein